MFLFFFILADVVELNLSNFCLKEVGNVHMGIFILFYFKCFEFVNINLICHNSLTADKEKFINSFY